MTPVRLLPFPHYPVCLTILPLPHPIQFSMSRLALACALFASVTFAFASPASVNGELVDIENRDLNTGRGTWFNPGLGNCGQENSDSDLILAIGKGLYDRRGGSDCGKMVHIESKGKIAIGKVADSCQSCNDNDIDMSPGLFTQLASLDVGVLQVSWYFMEQ